MSPNSPNFVNDLVEMATAFKRLPEVEASLADARGNIDSLQATVQRLELKLIERANQIAELQQRARSLEVERDEAQFQALEEQDRTTSFKRFVETMFGQAGNLLNAAKPEPKPEPEVKAEPSTSAETATAQLGQREADPIAISSVSEPAATVEMSPVSPSDTVHEAGGYVAERGSYRGLASEDHIDGPMKGHADMGEQSAPSTESQSASAPSTAENVEGARAMPIEAQPQGEGVSVQPDPTLGHGETTSGNASPDSKPQNSGQYFGKRYTDVDHYVSLSVWLANGGTEADYYAR